MLFKKRRSFIYTVVVWCLALAGCVPPLFFKEGRFEFQPGKSMCLYTFESHIAYTVLIECFYVATPLTVITICYVTVFRTVSRSNRIFSSDNNPSQLCANVEEAKVTKTLVTVLFSFVFCWLPIFVVDCTDAAPGERAMSRQVYLMYAFLAYLSSTINPCIYGIMNKHFKREYKVLSRKFACFRRQCKNNNKNNNSNHNAESGVWILFTILSLREFRSPPQQTDSKEEIITSSELRPKNILPRGLAF